MKKPKLEKSASKDVQDKVSIFQSVTTIHGTKQFSRKKGNQLSLWKFLMIANVVMTVSFILVISAKFNNDQIVTKVCFMLFYYFSSLTVITYKS